MSELGPLPEPVSRIGHGPVVNFTSVQPALKTKPHGQINCYAEDDLIAERERCYALGVAAERERLTAQFEARIADKFVNTEDTMIWTQALHMVKR